MSRWLCLLTLLLVLAGCSSQSLQVPAPETTQPNADLWHWQAQGRLAVTAAEKRHSMSIDWQQKGADYELLFTGPLGQGSARLLGQPFYVVLTTSQGETLAAASPEALLRQGLGWALPLSNLVYWVRGLPAPGPYTSEHKTQGSQALSGLQQAGWVVEWRRFIAVDGYRLPSLLVARQGELEVRLAINTWQLDLSPSERLQPAINEAEQP